MSFTIFAPLKIERMSKKENIFQVAARMLKYTLTTLLGTGTDCLVLWFFSHQVFSSYVGQVIVSPMISFECAVMVNFLTAYFYVWRERIDRTVDRCFIRHFWKYNLTCISAFLVKMVLLVLVEKAFQIDVVLCNLIALTLSGLVNFCIQNNLVFRKKTPKELSEELQESDNL